MEKNQILKEKKANSIKASLVSNSVTGAQVKIEEIYNSVQDENKTKITIRDSFELYSPQNLFIIEKNEDSLLKIIQFIEIRYPQMFQISVFTNIVQALLKVDNNTSIFIFDCNYFEKASSKIIRFIRNRNNKTLVIYRFDKKKTTSSINVYIKKRFYNLLEETAIQMEVNPSGLKQVVMPFHSLKFQYGARKNYPYLILLLLIVGAIFLLNI